LHFAYVPPGKGTCREAVSSGLISDFMKPATERSLRLIILAASIQFQISSFGQGSLTPPGAPAPTFKTLSQVEPRYPISDYQTNLTLPGSYYLTTNLFSGANQNDAINVRTNISNITIDLNGFSIICSNGNPAASPVGVRISNATNIVIRNGQFIGFDRAIRAEGLFYGIVVDNIHVHGCTRTGIEANATVGTAYQTITIRNCVVEDTDSTSEAVNVSADGITLLNCSALVQNCVIRDMVPAGTGVGSCIDAITCTNTFFDNNFFANTDIGIKTTGAGTRYYYRNNLAAGVATPFSVTGGVDRGGNF
jgi:hypothetical protein